LVKPFKTKQSPACI